VFERALRRAEIPMAYSAGFSPHPKVSWVGAAATGVASEAEYVEIALAEVRDVEAVRAALDASLPDGIDLVEAVEAAPGTSLADLVQASAWRIELPQVAPEALAQAVAAFLSTELIEVERMTKNGRRVFDTRGPVVSMRATDGNDCAILHVVVRHVTPAVRPDDVLSGLRSVSDLATPVPPAATRLSQGPLTADGEVGDPLAPVTNGATRQVDEAVGSP
jgi:radical SAM-linked protein